MTLMTRLVQLKRGDARRVALVEEPQLRLLDGCSSIYELANSAISAGVKLSELARKRATGEPLEYEPICQGQSEWRILPPIDHPGEPARCLVSGTGLTHMGSARGRQSMHASTEADLTDSMKMFRWGIEGGRPVPGAIGVAPEWFYKGTGTILRAHGDALDVPPYAEDGGEEAEIAASTSSLPTASRAASAWPAATNFRIMYLKRRTISIWRLQASHLCARS